MDCLNSANENPWTHKSFSIVDKNSIPVRTEQQKDSAHAFLYCKSSAILFDTIPMKYGIMMQLRFDGMLGFPGGLIEKDELPVNGLNRELHEEIHLEEKYFLSEENYICSWLHPTLIDHFYVKEFSESDFKKIEIKILEAKDWGSESLGIVRVPVHTLRKHSKIPPFASFLGHSFISCAQEQLIHCILHKEILTRAKMLSLWESHAQHKLT